MCSLATAKALDRFTANLGDDVPLPPGLEPAAEEPQRQAGRKRVFGP